MSQDATAVHLLLSKELKNNPHSNLMVRRARLYHIICVSYNRLNYLIYGILLKLGELFRGTSKGSVFSPVMLNILISNLNKDLETMPLKFSY